MKSFIRNDTKQVYITSSDWGKYDAYCNTQEVGKEKTERQTESIYPVSSDSSLKGTLEEWRRLCLSANQGIVGMMDAWGIITPALS
jgi:hypothetical protein